MIWYFYIYFIFIHVRMCVCACACVSLCVSMYLWSCSYRHFLAKYLECRGLNVGLCK